MIRAFSRTNKVFDKEKTIGNIVAFVPDFESKVNHAVKLYSDSNDENAFSASSDEELRTTAKMAYKIINNTDLTNIIEDPQNNEATAKEFITAVKVLYENYRIMRYSKEFNISDIDKSLDLEIIKNYQN